MNALRVGRRCGRWGWRGAAASLLGMLLILPAFACTPSAQVTAKPARAESDSTVQIEGRLFDPQGFEVRVMWGGATGPQIATAHVNDAGYFTVNVTVPQVERGGWYLITASQRYNKKDAEGNLIPDQYDYWVRSFPIEVPGPAPAPEPAPAQPAPPVQEALPAPEVVPASEPAAASGPAQAADPKPAAVKPRPPVAVAESVPPAPETAPAASEPVPAEPAPPAADTRPVEQPLPVGQNVDRSGPRSVDAGTGSPWLIVPLALLGLGLFGLGTAAFVHEMRQRRAEAET